MAIGGRHSVLCAHQHQGSVPYQSLAHLDAIDSFDRQTSLDLTWRASLGSMQPLCLERSGTASGREYPFIKMTQTGHRSMHLFCHRRVLGNAARYPLVLVRIQAPDQNRRTEITMQNVLHSIARLPEARLFDSYIPRAWVPRMQPNLSECDRECLR
jgi:hypothetical protein